MKSANAYDSVPSVSALLEKPEIRALTASHGRSAVLEAIRATLDEMRFAIKNGSPAGADAEPIERTLARKCLAAPSLRPALNATGILLHTGLGRSPLAAEACAAAIEIAAGYSNLELNLETGDRGERCDHVRSLLLQLTGAEDAIAVNNNAGATILALRALAHGREVIVSRGQLVEIGGRFRLPEIFEVSGARLREVGTTNRTRLADYESAISPQTAAILRVHPSNYRILGFAESPGIVELAGLAKSRGLFVIDDIGSGAIDRERPRLPAGMSEPALSEGVAAGADLVLASGDKLLGGPQAGLIVGAKTAVARARNDPLYRALRLDKVTLAALAATLRLALDHDPQAPRIPLWMFINTPVDALMARACAAAARLNASGAWSATAEASVARLGGGSLPGQDLPSACIALAPPFPGGLGSGADALAKRLRAGRPAVVGRISEGRLLLDLRAIPPDRDEQLVEAIERCADLGRSG